MAHPRPIATTLGLLALLCWSTSNALTRSLVERIGPFTLLAVSFGTGGLLLASFETLRHGAFRATFRIPWRYAAICGPCFIGYSAAYALAYSMAPDDATALVLGLVNYLWPMWILILSLLFFPLRARWALLGPGVVLGLAGIVAAVGQDMGSFAQAVARSPAAFACMGFAALAWGLYSNAARRFAGPSGAGGVALFQLATGLLFGILCRVRGEASHWDLAILPPLAFHAICVCGCSYALWDHGVRRGDMVLLGSASYLVPVAATAIACAWLGQPWTWGLGLGSALVVAGALLCRLGIVERPGHPG